MNKGTDYPVQQPGKNGNLSLKDIAKRLKIALVTYHRLEPDVKI